MFPGRLSQSDQMTFLGHCQNAVVHRSTVASNQTVDCKVSVSESPGLQMEGMQWQHVLCYCVDIIMATRESLYEATNAPLKTKCHKDAKQATENWKSCKLHGQACGAKQ